MDWIIITIFCTYLHFLVYNHYRLLTANNFNVQCLTHRLFWKVYFCLKVFWLYKKYPFYFLDRETLVARINITWLRHQRVVVIRVNQGFKYRGSTVLLISTIMSTKTIQDFPNLQKVT